jgi:outer membrane protein assembly factor BamB
MKPIVATIALGLAIAAGAGDWPQYRGPTYAGVTVEKNLDFKNAQERWRQDVFSGFSAVAIADGRVYTMGNKQNTDYVFCLDADSGEKIWAFEYPCQLDPNMYEGGPNATPTVRNGKVYTLSKEGHMHCLDAGDGKEIWQRHAKKFGAQPPSWGFAGSVTVIGNTAVYNVGKGGVGLDATTGKTMWATGGNDAGYATPVPVTLNGDTQIVLATGKRVVALDPISGDEKWEFRWKTSYDVNAADPVFFGNSFLISSGYGTGAAAARVDGDSVTRLWRNKKLKSHFNTAVFWQGHIYGLDGDSGSRSSLVCLDPATGDINWRQKDIGFGSLIIADSKLVVLNETGHLFIVAPQPESYEELHHGRPINGKCWTQPAIADGRLYLRNATGTLVCLNLKQED